MGAQPGVSHTGHGTEDVEGKPPGSSVSSLGRVSSYAAAAEKQDHVECNETSTGSNVLTPAPSRGPTSPVGAHDGAVPERGEETSEPPLPYSKARCIALVITTSGAAFQNILSFQAAVIILPPIGRDLGVPDARLQWIVSSYALSFGCFLLLWGRVADLYGKKRVFVLGSAWVTITTALCPLIRNEIGFDLFRGLQGLGAAANVPTALGILGTTFAPGKAKTYAFSAYGAGAPLGSIFGTIIAGFITTRLSWSWVFGVMAIISGVITVAGALIIPSDKSAPRQSHPESKATIDWVGAFLVTVGLFALLYALTDGNVAGWNAPWIPVLIVVSVAMVVAFVYWQHRLESRGDRAPLIKVSMFRKSKKFSAAMILMTLFFSSFNGFLVYATYFYQSYQGLGTFDTTLRFLPTGVAGLLTALAASQLLLYVPTWIILLAGNACVAIANLIFAIPIDPNTSYFATGMIAMSLSVIGSDTTWPSLTLFTSHCLPPEDQALGGALVNAVGQVGRAVGLAIATAVQMSVMAHGRGKGVQEGGPVMKDQPSLDGLRAGFWFNFAIGAGAVVVAALAFRGSGIIGKPQPKSKNSPVPACDDKRASQAAVTASVASSSV
ncbi:puromycin resistance protein pur8 [Magnaporthiopsis poae ATCC 64411]|uniref:Puromycin resistance protein pur8 n=1 Tax=Magnaporthiopsis poae (strain ATCC 64411 / 73-15) TaxID=644358 RepID=A0A0C4DWR8_MAGP6|nr:puromycin resistance protein pur8 [Magnaporthiopsis poae ATCC 64411]